MAAESISQGMVLRVKKGSGGALAAIGDVVSFSGPGSSRTVIQIGANDSANSTNVQKAGRVTRGGWNFTVNFDPDSATQAREAYAQMLLSSTIVNDTTHATGFFSWDITLDDGTVIDFTGFVSNFSIDGADDGVVTASFTVTLQSDISFT